MKNKIILGLVAATIALCGESFVLQLGNKTYNISTDKATTLTIDNHNYVAKLVKADTQLFKSKYVDFKYISSLQPAKQQLVDKLSQITMMTPVGSVIAVQEYYSGPINPDEIYKTMKTELLSNFNVQENIITNNTRTAKILADGSTLEGIEFSVINKQTQQTVNKTQLYFRTTKGKSVLVMIYVNPIEDIKDQNINRMIDLFWKTLHINF
jgi:hypothetical protein